MAKRIIFLLFGLLLAANASAQVMPRAGTHFTFGIPEGSDGLVDPSLGSGISLLIVNILSPYDGKGIITSPNGFCQEFTFIADSVTTVQLPYSFMHLKDIGKTNKGILIKTSQPANVTFHDFLSEAGEATQIYPDEALDTSYRITTWGLFNDPTEDNHTQFIITATQDSTDVTIIPSVLALGNHPPRVPIVTRLNRGECYIVKADTNGAPYDASLSNSTVSSTKPVSILAGVSCGYNPLGNESCDELLDQVLPKKYADTIFYVVPLRDTLVTNTVLFTSAVKDFFVIPSNGAVANSTNGRAQVNISSPMSFLIISKTNETAFAQCFLLSEGSESQVIGDPSIVTVLPRNQYVDTLYWYTPNFIGSDVFDPGPFTNYVSVIYPTSSESKVLLDGLPIASQASAQTIPSTPMSAAVPIIKPGVHRLISPVPVFATVSGFALADGYTFLPGTTSSKLQEDTLPTTLGISATPAKTCRNFDVPVSSTFKNSDDISSVRLTASYDPSILTLISVNLGPLAQGGQWITDTRNSGTIIVTGSCLTPFSDSGAIITATFAAGPSIITTSVSANIEIFGGDHILRVLQGGTNKAVSIQEVRDTMKATLSVDGGHSHFGSFDTATVRIVNAPNQQIDSLDLFVSYDHDIMKLLSAELNNTLLLGANRSVPISFDPATEKLHITFPVPLVLTTPGIIARLIFQTYLSDSTSGRIDVRGSLLNSRPCPLDIISDEASGDFIGTDTCGSESLRALMIHEPFVINSIVPNPSNGSFTIDLDRHLFGEPLRVSLSDMLGNEVWTNYHSSPDIHQKIPCTLEHGIPNGSYMVRISGSGKTVTQKIVIHN